QRVVVRHRREHALGESADPDAIELDTEREPDGTGEHALAEAADTIARGRELEFERASEHVDIGRGVDGVEPPEPVERGPGAARRLLFDLGPSGAGAPAVVAEVPTDEMVRPVRVRGPARLPRPERVGQLVDEDAQALGTLSLACGPAVVAVVARGVGVET